MSHASNKFWTFVALPASLLLLVAAYYVKVPSARAWIDAHVPAAQELLGRFVQDPAPSGDSASTKKTAKAVTPAPSAPVVAAVPAPTAATPVPTPPQPVTYDLDTLAKDRSLWPKQVRLMKATKFPAVVDGKEVGSLIAPAGTDVNLVGIREGKLALEYKGGGAWSVVADTDLGSRVPLR